MSKEIEALVGKTTNREGLARLLEHVADRCDEMRAEMFLKRTKPADQQAGGGHG